MKEYECPGCGNIVPDTDKCCKYCGSNNPNYVKPFSKIIFGDNSSSSSSSTSSSAHELDEPSKRKFSVGIFILLLIFCWPGALIYLIFCYSKKD